MQKIILASSSPRRKELLEKIGLKFEIVPSDFEEDMNQKMSPNELAKTLAFGKAESVAKNSPDSVVIGADTIVVLAEKVLGKPHTAERAREMLRLLSGKQHSVITGFAIIDTGTGKKFSSAVETKVFFKNLSEKEIEKYIQTGEPLVMAGAYAIQSGAALFVEKIEGDYYNVVGLPILALYNALKDFGVY